MSLINQMLRDLEVRQTSPSLASDGVIAELSAVESRIPGERVSARWMILPMVLGLTVVVGGYFSAQDRRSASAVVAAADRILESVSGVHVSSERARSEAPNGEPATPVASGVRPLPVDRSGLTLAMADVLGARKGARDPTHSGLETVLIDEAARFDAMLVSHPPAARAPMPVARPSAPARTPSESPAAVESAKFAERSVTESGGAIVKVRQTPAQRARSMLGEGQSLIASGRVTEGERRIYEALALDPGLDDAREVLAVRLLRYGRAAEARRLVAERPTGAAPKSRLLKLEARALTALGSLEAALALMTGNEPAIADDLEFHAIRAALLQRTARHPEAVTLYRSLLQQSPNRGRWWMGLGMSLDAAGHRHDAAQAYRRALVEGGLPQAAAGFVSKRLRLIQG